MDTQPRDIQLAISFTTHRDGQLVERGRERAAYDFNDDGTITYRATSTSFTPKVTRDVVYTLDGQFHPLDAYVRLQVEGQHEGSGWFRFEEGRVTAETWNARDGRATESMSLAGRPRAFLAHPVTSDALVCAAFDHTLPASRQRPPGIFDSSRDPYGRTGPALASSQVDIEFVGETRLETPAGEFAADHYRLYLDPADREPLEEIWCLAGTFVFLKAYAAGAFQTHYELTDWRQAGR
ncbi:MAG: hypothetical protein IT483_07935 [Gammaproteobacteria bacterium]|nr:hypothetical protein [Gammaproteobacteria bacterium]